MNGRKAVTMFDDRLLSLEGKNASLMAKPDDGVPTPCPNT